MNVIKVKVDFETGILYQQSGISLVAGDYNSTKIKFEFNEKAANGTKIFEVKNQEGNTIFVDQIINDEINLVYIDEEGKYHSIFATSGKYTYEISLYDGDSKLTSKKGYLIVIEEQVKTIGDEIVTEMLPVFDTLINTLNKEITASSNLNIEASKTDNVTTIELTDKEGNVSIVEINDGETGPTGATGPTPNLSVGNVETLKAGGNAYVNIHGNINNPVLDFGIPTATKTSQLDNDSNFATQEYVDNELATFDFIKVVDSLPESGLSNKIYLVPKADTQNQDLFDEYVWINNSWEWVTTKQIEVDLSGHVQFSNMPVMTQAEYDALATKDNNTYYFIEEEE